MTLSQWGTVALIASILGAFALWVQKVTRAVLAHRRERLISEIEDRVTNAIAGPLVDIGVRIDEHMKSEEQEREGMAKMIELIREDVSIIAGHTGARLRGR